MDILFYALERIVTSAVTDSFFYYARGLLSSLNYENMREAEIFPLSLSHHLFTRIPDPSSFLEPPLILLQERERKREEERKLESDNAEIYHNVSSQFLREKKKEKKHNLFLSDCTTGQTNNFSSNLWDAVN